MYMYMYILYVCIYIVCGKDGTVASAYVHNQDMLEEFEDVKIGVLAQQ